jgi:hypothetical protein
MQIKAETSYIELVSYKPEDDEIEIIIIPRSASVITNHEEIDDAD